MLSRNTLRCSCRALLLAGSTSEHVLAQNARGWALFYSLVYVLFFLESSTLPEVRQVCSQPVRAKAYPLNRHGGSAREPCEVRIYANRFEAQVHLISTGI